MLEVALFLTLLSPPSIEVDLTQLAPEASRAIAKQEEKLTTDASEWHQLGVLYHAHGLEDPAIQAYRYALELEPTPNTRYLLGVALARVGLYEEAIEEVSTIDNYVPALWQQGFWNLDLGNFETASTKFKEAIAKDKNCVAAIIGLARVHLATESPQEAVILLEDITSRGGSHPYLTFLLGTAHRRSGNHAIASKLLATQVNGPPKWNDPWVANMLSNTKGYAADLARAMQSIDTGNLGDALKQFESLAKRYPKDTAVLNNFATVYLKLGQLQKAEETLKNSMRWSPNYAPSQLAMAFVMQAKGKIDLAIAYANKAIQFQPAMSAAHTFAGKLFFQKGDMQSAANYFEQAITLGDSDPTTREMHGMVLLNLGKPNLALQQFNLVLQIAANRPTSISGKAIATALLGNPVAALQLLAKAKAKYPKDPTIERAWQSVLQIKGRQ
jgi:tetratricopeptide (TPR) repeat protein